MVLPDPTVPNVQTMPRQNHVSAVAQECFEPNCMQAVYLWEILKSAAQLGSLISAKSARKSVPSSRRLVKCEAGPNLK